MGSNDRKTRKARTADPRDAAPEPRPAVQDTLRAAVTKLLDSLDPDVPADGSLRRVIEEVLDRVVQMEARLGRAEGRVEWLESQNVRDEITGLLNRRGLDDALDRALARARRYGETGSLLLFELSGYEEINETRGTEGGDYVLAAAANILLREFREVDYVARLEGGRFAVLMLKIGVDDTRRRASMLADRFRALAVPWDGDDLAVPVRFAMAAYSRHDTVAELLERAQSELESRERRIAGLRRSAR
ncbi:MAG: GGDEF domain-containing protein [Rhodospirillales bacterium]|nr:MAG: GGDEF domain-containing protein [Rhodospirillales bacterium]